MGKNGPGTPRPRGYDSVTVRLRLDNHFAGTSFQTLANMPRPDLMNHTNPCLSPSCLIPNAAHGFRFGLSSLPAKALKGLHRLDVAQVDFNSAGKATHIHPVSN